METRPDGKQVAVLRVASADGGFAVIATTLGPQVRSSHRRLRCMAAGTYREEVAANVAQRPALRLDGVIIARSKPELRDGRGSRAQFSS